jgi:hypothetical protein
MARKHSHKTWTYKEVRIVREGLRAGKTQAAIAKEVGRAPNPFRMWLYRNRRLVSDVLYPPGSKGRMFQARVLQHMRAGMGPPEIAVKEGVTLSYVQRIVRGLIKSKKVVMTYHPGSPAGMRYTYYVHNTSRILKKFVK